MFFPPIRTISHMKTPTFPAAALGLLLLAGCGGFETHLPDPKTLVKGYKSYDAFTQYRDEGDAAWFARNTVPEADRGATIRAAIASYEKAWATYPDSPVVLERLTEAHYYLANYYAQGQDEKEKVYLTGMGYGERAMLLDPEVKKAVEGGQELYQAVAAHAKVEQVPAIFWYTVSWGRVAEDKNIATRATTAPKLKTMMETVYRLCPRYYWGGVNRFFGVYFTKAPGQKDPANDSKREFDRAMQFPEDLENRVLMAEYYAPFVQDRALYEKTLKEVIALPDTYGPQLLRLDNSEAKKRAKKLLGEAEDKF
jgi:hypothetical protein